MERSHDRCDRTHADRTTELLEGIENRVAVGANRLGQRAQAIRHRRAETPALANPEKHVEPSEHDRGKRRGEGYVEHHRCNEARHACDDGQTGARTVEQPPS